MKKTVLATLAIVVFLLGPGSAFSEDSVRPNRSFVVTAQVGLNSYVKSADFQADPFDALPFPVGGSFEYAVSGNFGIGGTVMFDKWCDYLGMFGGKWTFRLFKPSFDITYHFRSEKKAGLDVFAGASVGYSILSVGNELGGRYEGRLKSEPHLAPFLGTNVRLRQNPAGFWGRLSVMVRASWSVHGRFSGVYGALGIGYRIK
ncbi:MAG: hypothetical protein OEW05_01105 [Candidatus Aminicenantes bacterium]|nr:hypothetical protein [Candidatus Aminicenantes bacterium]